MTDGPRSASAANEKKDEIGRFEMIGDLLLPLAIVPQNRRPQSLEGAQLRHELIFEALVFMGIRDEDFDSLILDGTRSACCTDRVDPASRREFFVVAAETGQRAWSGPPQPEVVVRGFRSWLHPGAPAEDAA